MLAGGDAGACAISGIILFLYFLIKSHSSSEGGSTAAGGYRSGTMGTFELRALEVKRGDSNNLRAIAIEARGLIPVFTTCEVDFVVFAMDVTDPSNEKAVFCTIERFQMPDSPCFRSFKRGTSLSPNQGFGEWTEIGVAPTDCLVAPKSGLRRLKFYGMTVRRTPESTNLRDLSEITSATATMNVQIAGIGYEEKSEKRVEAICLSIKLGIAVAYADGNLEPSEAKSIKDWSAKRHEELPDSEQPEAKEKINSAIREAGEQARKGMLSIEAAAGKLRESPLAGIEMLALELCVKVMAADGNFDPKELEVVRHIGSLLGISYEDIRNLTDKHPPSATTQSGSAELTDEQFVGITPGLTPEDIRKEIRKLFSTYNARLSIEKDPNKRANYQRKLEALARLKQKHG